MKFFFITIVTLITLTQMAGCATTNEVALSAKNTTDTEKCGPPTGCYCRQGVWIGADGKPSNFKGYPMLCDTK